MNSFDKHIVRYREKVSEYLRANVPEIQKLESLDDLQDLRLTKAAELDRILMLQYEAKGTNLFPQVRQRLIDKGIAKRHNMIGTHVDKKGTYEETYCLNMGFYGSTLRISLKVYK